MNAASGHTFAFARLGGVDQALFRTGEDFGRLAELDQKLWVALACPVNGVAIDRRTLELMDGDADGRIRATELLAAIDFVKQRVGTDGINAESDQLHVHAIDTSTDAGARLLEHLDRDGKTSLSLAEVIDAITRFSARPLNGDGVIAPEAAKDEEIEQVMQEIIDLIGHVTDRNGKPGLDRKISDAFFDAVSALSSWYATGNSEEIRPLGDATEAAHGVFRIVRAKVEDYFARTRLAEFDPRAVDPLNRDVEALALIASKELSARSAPVAELPLARVTPGAALPLERGLNPAWEQEVKAFARGAIVPLLGERSELDREGWSKIVEALAPFDRWSASRPDTPVAKLDRARIQELASGTARGEIERLIALDLSTAPELAELEELERLLRYQRDLKTLAENFVSFADFYHPEALASFQAGRLYMDAREADLCIQVDDLAKHASLAATSMLHLAYCELYRKATNEKKTICAAFTAGIGQTLFVGRNGVFYDREGKDWDATIVKIVEAPVTLSEAFWAPWRKIRDMIGAQISKLLEAKEAAVQASASSAVGGAAKQPDPAKPSPPAPQGAAIASSIAAIGIALGFVGTAVAGLLGYVAGVPLWKTVLGLGGVVLIVSLPSVAIAYFKIRRRDLAPVLNASGWAMNPRIRLEGRLSARFTSCAALPKGAKRRLFDPYADSHAVRNLLITAVVVAASIGALWYTGFLDTIIAAIAAR